MSGGAQKLPPANQVRMRSYMHSAISDVMPITVSRLWHAPRVAAPRKLRPVRQLVGAAAVAFEDPEVLSLDVAKHVVVAAFNANTEKGLARRVPAVFHFDDFQGLLADLQPHGTFIATISGIALDLDEFHDSNRSSVE